MRRTRSPMRCSAPRTAIRVAGRPCRPTIARPTAADMLTGLHQIEHVMGMPVGMELREDLPYPTLAALADGVFGWLRLVDDLFSTHKPDSEVSRIGRGELRLSECSPEVRTVMDRCAALRRATDGYFDVYATGRLDPSGYVKGWAVQVGSNVLAAAGAGNHRLNAGGDVRVKGRPGPGQLWQIGVNHPSQPSALHSTIVGTDLGIATSGTHELGPHVVDPRRGTSAEHLRSVTVVGPDLGVADAYATAAVAMGAAGLDWLRGLDGYEWALVTADGRYVHSSGLPTL